MSRYFDADKIEYFTTIVGDCEFAGYKTIAFKEDIDEIPTADVVELPCKIGDTVYCIWQYSDCFGQTHTPFIREAKVAGFILYEREIKTIPDNYDEMTDRWYRLLDVAFTKDEAEKILAELKKKYLGEDINAPTKESEGEG